MAALRVGRRQSAPGLCATATFILMKQLPNAVEITQSWVIPGDLKTFLSVGILVSLRVRFKTVRAPFGLDVPVNQLATGSV